MQYRSPKGLGSSELIERRSRFIGHVSPVTSKEDAEAFISSVKEQFLDARHNVYAYKVGLDTPLERVSDDGEPRGTAGYPILEVINKRNLQNAVCVVTRYFGGTLLGSGGLLRAYGRTATMAFDDAQEALWVYHHLLRIGIGYDNFGKIKREIENRGYSFADIVYGENVNLKSYIKKEETEILAQVLNDIANGQIEIDILEGMHLPV